MKRVLCRRNIGIAVLLAIAGGSQPRLSAAEDVGSLLVESDPIGAAVYVDGRPAGDTPLIVETIAAGVHRVRVVRLGYLENSRLVTVKAGGRATLRVRLTDPAPQAPRTAALKIVVIEGEGAVNIIQQKTAVAPVVEVRDRNDQPVAGAVVRFAIQKGRATFNGARTLTVSTDALGRATAAGLAPTGSGPLSIAATATFQGQTAVAAIAQTTVATAAQASSAAGAAAGGAGGGGGGGLSGVTIAGIAGGVGAGALVAVRAGQDRDSDSGTPTDFRNVSYDFNFGVSLSVIQDCPLYTGNRGPGVGPFGAQGPVNPDGTFSFLFSVGTPAGRLTGRFTQTDVTATISCEGGSGPTGSLSGTGTPTEYQGTWNWGPQSGALVVRRR